METPDEASTLTTCQTICSNSDWCVGYSYKAENKECNLYWLWTEGNRRVVDITAIEGYDFKDVECSVGSELRKNINFFHMYSHHIAAPHGRQLS